MSGFRWEEVVSVDVLTHVALGPCFDCPHFDCFLLRSMMGLWDLGVCLLAAPDLATLYTQYSYTHYTSFYAPQFRTPVRSHWCRI